MANDRWSSRQTFLGARAQRDSATVTLVQESILRKLGELDATVSRLKSDKPELNEASRVLVLCGEQIQEIIQDQNEQQLTSFTK